MEDILFMALKIKCVKLSHRIKNVKVLNICNKLVFMDFFRNRHPIMKVIKRLAKFRAEFSRHLFSIKLL